MAKTKLVNVEDKDKVIPVITDIRFNVGAEQLYPGSSFLVWDSGCFCPDAPGKEETPRMLPATIVLDAFKEKFISQFWTAIRRRGGKLRIKITIEWLP